LFFCLCNFEILMYFSLMFLFILVLRWILLKFIIVLILFMRSSCFCV
jgi:hypothetical protein